MTPLLIVEDVTKHFAVRRRTLFRTDERLRAVDGVTLEIFPNETLGLVGESGCGKSTLSRVIAGLHKPTSGRVLFMGDDIHQASPKRLKELRREIQIVFQDPHASLNPRMRVAEIIAEPWDVHPHAAPNGARSTRVAELLELVGLNADHANRFPHQFSGGQKQRIGIARALALSPKLLVCDEPVSALDVSIQAQIINLLQDLQDELRLSYLFVAHDLAVVEHISNRLAVMYLGRIVECGPTDKIYSRPAHPYTLALLSASPSPHRKTSPIILEGDVPSPVNPPSGCRFNPRCWKGDSICRSVDPRLSEADGRQVACHYPIEAHEPIL